MIELLLTVLFSTLTIIAFRVMDLLKIDDLSSIVINYVFATLWGVFYLPDIGDFMDIPSKAWFEITILTGIMFIITFFLMSRSAVRAGVAITAVAGRMSVVLPVLAGIMILHEQVSLLKVIGIVMALFSFYLVLKPDRRIPISAHTMLYPILLFLGVGMNDSVMKYIQHHYLADDEMQFLIVVFGVAFVIGMIILVYRYFRYGKLFGSKEIGAGLVLGSLNFSSTYFFIRGMMLFDSSFYFPTVNVSIVLLTTVAGLTFFREKLRLVNWIGIAAALIAIALIQYGS